MRVIFAILLALAGGAFLLFIPGFGLSEDPVTQHLNATVPADNNSPAAMDQAETAVEAAIRAAEQSELQADETAVATPDNILPDIKNIDIGTISDIQRATLKRLVETAYGNPDLFRSALSRAKSILQ